MLRVILEKALSDDASHENLDKYLPDIREIIVTLLQKLKQKQALIRASGSSVGSAPSIPLPTYHHNSTSHPQPPTHGRYQQTHQGPGPQPQQQSQPHSHQHANPGPPPSPRLQMQGQMSQISAPMKYPTRSESLSSPASPLASTMLPPRHNSVGGHSGAGPRTSSAPDSVKLGGGVPGFQARPPPPPPGGPNGPNGPGPVPGPGGIHIKKNNSRSNLSNISITASNAPRSDYQRGPPSSSPRKESSNPLATLQRSEALERRASRRFSAYQFAKLTNGPQAAREAVPEMPPLPSDKRSSLLPTTSSHSSSMADYTLSTSVVDKTNDQQHLAATIKDTTPSGELAAQKESPSTQSRISSSPQVNGSQEQFPGTIPVFLQIGHKVKKAMVDPSDITIASLRLQFIEKFAYSPGSEAFPDIYIQDPKSGIRYELDETSLDEVKKGSVLVSLNIKEMDEVKKHFSEGLAKLAETVNNLHSKIDDNTSAINQLKETKVNSIATTSSQTQSRSETPMSTRPTSKISLKQVEAIRKDVAVLRQVSASSLGGLKDELAGILTKAKALQNTSFLIQQSGSSRAFMEQCHKKLSAESDSLLTNVDDLQDVIEALRKDVAQRGVRHTPRQLETVAKELAVAKEDLEKMTEYITNERPSWKKIWERELDVVCEEQQFFKLQEELVADLRDDLSKAEETFKLVEMCSQEQSKVSGGRRPTQPTILSAPVDGIVHVKDAVLSEVSALQPNHEQRVEAIERAEKMRRKELELRSKGGEFEEELEEFVGENKLKKSGGVEETERRLKLREQKMLEEQRKNDAEAKLIRDQERERRKLERQKERGKREPIPEDDVPLDAVDTANPVVEPEVNTTPPEEHEVVTNATAEHASEPVEASVESLD
ncbi:Bud6p [Sugiyamaella lignohabitans]|uniref:Bud6p n=1 Tax=Sugiyamaella lignohabitans TaxID=796027 RepID=A0A167CQ34_9ASCO|nr:Bud6p [Sugiyamaella lignohabitans]ANB11972.1 Bud6p [Sugiyamaella lignohabitans]